jgi:hypothetical protein
MDQPTQELHLDVPGAPREGVVGYLIPSLFAVVVLAELAARTSVTRLLAACLAADAWCRPRPRRWHSDPSPPGSRRRSSSSC